MSYNNPSYDYLNKASQMEISAAVHAKNEHIAREMYGTKVAKELRRVLKKAWNHRATSKEIFFAMKRANDALAERKAA
ncbi:MAG TPA: hypothetical protein VMW10_08725 [Alphaproteobacteria bacterium]|nr:hypothetical protein [Alphaproteobacteria bacterium]